MFDEYVSLGNRCEVAFQFRRILGRDSSSFFSWNVTSLKSLNHLLGTRFEGLFQLENLEPNEWLVHETRGDFYFHLQGEGRKSATHPAFPDDVARHREKAAYLIEKFYKDAASGKKIAYFYRNEDDGDIRDAVTRVRDFLAEAHGELNFALVVIQDESRMEPDWGIDGVYNRYMRRLAKYDDQGDGHLQSWDAVFREFPHKEELRFCNWV